MQPDRQDLAYRYVKALYTSGGAEEAAAEFEKLAAQLDDEQRINQSVELARYLRRMSQPADAMKVFEKVVGESPERIDIRRELAETYLAVGKRQAARRLFTPKLARDASIENFLDVVGFMIAQELLVEAKGSVGRAARQGRDELRPALAVVGRPRETRVGQPGRGSAQVRPERARRHGLPRGTGQDLKVAVFADGPDADVGAGPAPDIVGLDDLAEQVKAGEARLRRGESRDAGEHESGGPAGADPRGRGG